MNIKMQPNAYWGHWTIEQTQAIRRNVFCLAFLLLSQPCDKGSYSILRFDRFILQQLSGWPKPIAFLNTLIFW